MVDDQIINRLIGQINPTESEVDNMSEEDWATYVYPIKCFRMGQEYEHQKIMDVLGSAMDLSSDGSVTISKKDIEILFDRGKGAP